MPSLSPQVRQRILGYVAVATIFIAGCAAATFYVMFQRSSEQLVAREAKLEELKKQLAASQADAKQATLAMAEAQERLRAGETEIQPLREHVEAFAKQAAACASTQSGRDPARKAS